MNRAPAICQPLTRTVVWLAGLALLLGMLAITPAPVKAADPEPSYTAAFDACPEDRIPDADFSDVSDQHANFSDINCIFYYDITEGKPDNRYAPDDPVIREHMALFLVRMAEKVGIDVPSAGSTPFTDIVNLPEESRAAISKIYKLGITVGDGKNNYKPRNNVTRGEMALFLQRLMDEMDTVTDGRELYGYRPDDVDDNDENFEVETPYQDLARVTHEVNDAVTELYELGVGSGLNGSSSTYGPNDDMTRAAMAEFMAAILDHSNLRPPDILAQLATAPDGDQFDITAMISVRDNRFRAVEEVVDWFHTDDPAGGLREDGTCDPTKISGSGDCIWRDRNSSTDAEDKDGATDRHGNLFATFEAEAGDTITFYAWIGRRNEDVFDRYKATYSPALVQLVEGGGDFSVTHDIPEHAAVMGRDTYIVDRRSSVEFTIQLLNSAGAALAEGGVEVEIEVESQEITVDAAAVSRGRPDPDYNTVGRDSTEELIRTTDQDGQAVFLLDGPLRDERLDIVTIFSDCCDDQEFRIAWSDSDPVLVAAKPTFEPYQYRSSDGDEVEFQIEYLLYDQYGELVDRRTDRYNQVEAEVEAWLYEGKEGSDHFRFSRVSETDDLREQFSLWRVRATVEKTNLKDNNEEYFILVDPNIVTGSGSSEIAYADPMIVWVVTDARSDNDLEDLKEVEWGNVTPKLPSGVPFEEVEIYPGDENTGKFRTFFTMWSYDSDSRLEVDGNEVGVEEFERAWQRRVDDVDDLTIPIYGPINFIRIK